MEHWLLVIVVQVVIGALVTILGFLMKRSISQIDDRLKSGDTKFKEICEDIADIKEKRMADREYFAKEYVSKDDFIRDVRALDWKIEQVAQDVKKLLVLSGGRREDSAEI